MDRLLRGAEVQELVELRREGLSISEISRLAGLSRHTVRKYVLRPETPVYGPREPRGSKLDAYKPYIEGRLKSGVWNGVVLLRELQGRGYAGAYTILKDYLCGRREAARESAERRFETGPGEQGQVDWTHVGEVTIDGESHPLWGFALTLGHSRAMFADVSVSQRLDVFLRMHEEAFRALGGVPREILYDQVKTVVLGFDDRGEARFCQVFLDFARYWGFRPRLCHAYRAKTKGKVERGNGYLKQSFLCGREASSVDDLRTQLVDWLATVGNRRVHGTTHRVVSEAWEAERPYLQPLAGRGPYPYIPEEERRVAFDAYVQFRTNRYSVPWRAAGRRVGVRDRGDRLEIAVDGQVIAEHPMCDGRYQVVTQQAHHAGMPYEPSGPPRRGKVRIVMVSQAPEVEVRPLAAYEAFGTGGVAAC